MLDHSMGTLFTSLSRLQMAYEIITMWSSWPAERCLIITSWIFITHDIFLSWNDNAYMDMHFDEYHTDRI